MDKKQLIGNLLGISGYNDFLHEERVSTLKIALRGSRKLSGRSL